MSLARDLVRLQEQLSGMELFQPLGQSGLLTAPEAREALERLEAMGLQPPGPVLRLCLQSLSVQRSELAPRLIEPPTRS
jgi:hypothetical protein